MVAETGGWLSLVIAEGRVAVGVLFVGEFWGIGGVADWQGDGRQGVSRA